MLNLLLVFYMQIKRRKWKDEHDLNSYIDHNFKLKIIFYKKTNKYILILKYVQSFNAFHCI